MNATVRGWAEYYRHTSLLSDIEDVSRYVWHRYLLWLRAKHKGSRKGQLIAEKTRTIQGRTRWTATITEGGKTLTAHQWEPTRAEYKRGRYLQKGAKGFGHPYLSAAADANDYPHGEIGPPETIFTNTIGARSRRETRNEPLDMRERMLRAKLRDDFACQRCGATEHVRAHHLAGVGAHGMTRLITLCEPCHKAEHGFGQLRFANQQGTD